MSPLNLRKLGRVCVKLPQKWRVIIFWPLVWACKITCYNPHLPWQRRKKKTEIGKHFTTLARGAEDNFRCDFFGDVLRAVRGALWRHPQPLPLPYAKCGKFHWHWQWHRVGSENLSTPCLCPIPAQVLASSIYAYAPFCCQYFLVCGLGFSAFYAPNAC